MPRLFAFRWWPRATTSLGMAGTGGASWAPRDCEYPWPMVPLLLGRCGLGDLKVRSVMDPELPLLCKPGRGSGSEEALDDTDALRRTVRFVCTSATLVGACGRALSAAAAAAEESERPVPGSRRWKAEAAAVVALVFAGDKERGCIFRVRPSAQTQKSHMARGQVVRRNGAPPGELRRWGRRHAEAADQGKTPNSEPRAASLRPRCGQVGRAEVKRSSDDIPDMVDGVSARRPFCAAGLYFRLPLISSPGCPTSKDTPISDTSRLDRKRGSEGCVGKWCGGRDGESRRRKREVGIDGDDG